MQAKAFSQNERCRLVNPLVAELIDFIENILTGFLNCLVALNESRLDACFPTTGQAGTIVVTASSPGPKPAELKLEAKGAR